MGAGRFLPAAKCPNLAGGRSAKNGRRAIREKMEGPAIMSKHLAAALYVLAMVAVIVAVDFLFLRDRFWARLAANVGIVLVFAAFYLLVLRRG
jgi:hypothetical protein